MRPCLALVTMLATVLLGAVVVLGCSSSAAPGASGADAAGIDVVTHDVTTPTESGDGPSGGGDSAGGDSTIDASVDVVGSADGGTSDAGIAVQVLGQSGALTTQQERDFFAVVTGTTNTAVTWAVVEAQGGTITKSGQYTAPGTAGTYHVTATSQADSAASAEVAVDVVAAPVATLTVPGVVTTAATGLGASVPTQAGATYTWSMTGGTITAGAGTSAITFTAGAPGTLVVSCVVANAAGATATGTANVVVSATAVISISAPASATTGATGLVASVPAQTGATYAWTITGGTITGGGGTSVVTFTAGAAGNLTLGCTVTVAGTPITGTTSVAVVAAPVAVITAPASAGVLATGLAASVPVQTNATYTWSISNGTITAGAATAAITFTAGVAGTLTLTCTVTNAAGTSASGTASVSVVAAPTTPTISAPSAATAGTTGLAASIVVQVGSTYAWTITGGSITSATNDATIVFTAGAVGTLTLGVTVTNAAGSASATATVNIVATPVVSITAPSTAASGATGLVATVGSQAGATYAWTITGGTITAGAGTSSITFTAGAAGTLTLGCTVTIAGTPTSGTATVTVISAPTTPTISAPSEATAGTAGLVASVTPQAGVTYAWTITGGTITSAINSATIVFTAGNLPGPVALGVSVTNAVGTANASANVTVVAAPVVSITAPSTATPGQTGLTASVQAQTGDTYAWTINDGGAITAGAGTASITFTAGSAGTMTIGCTVTNAAGTAISGTATVVVGTTGSLTVTITGIPANGSVTVSGPGTFSTSINATQTLSSLVPGSYSVTAPQFIYGGLTYTAVVTGSPVTLNAGDSANATVTYTSFDNPPTISTIVNQTVYTNSTFTIPFTIGDTQVDPSTLTVSGSAITSGVVTWSFGGSGANRTLLLTGAPTTGSTSFTVTVSDSIIPAATASTTFNVTVLAAIVTNTNDSGPGSLRYVLSAVAAGTTVTFDPSTFDPNGGTITLLSTITISQAVTIQGPGASLMTVSGGGSVQMFVVSSGNVTISGLTLSGGNCVGGANGEFGPAGGAINNVGPTGNASTLTVSGSTFTSNSCPGNSNSENSGGAIYNGFNGTLVITGCTFTSNTAAFRGGAIQSFGSSLAVTGSTFTSNTASSLGGAIDNNGNTFTVTGSTFTSNTNGAISYPSAVTSSTFYGNSGPIYTESGPTFVNVTVTGNTGGQSGGQVFYLSGGATFVNVTVTGNAGGPAFYLGQNSQVQLRNSIVAGNSQDLESSPVCCGNTPGSVTSLGYNIIGSTSGANYIPAAGDQIGVSTSTLALDALANCGGPTKTMLPASTSPAVAIIPAANCVDANSNPLTVDQRGFTRPAGLGSTCTIGADERQATESCP